MDNSFFAYLQQLELMFFFSGFPLIYAMARVIGRDMAPDHLFTRRLVPALGPVYALAGTLFLGFELKKLYPHYSFASIAGALEHPYLVGWGILSILFWIPAIGKKVQLTLIHSLVFFFLLVKDLFSAFGADSDVVSNDMKVYAASVILNFFILVILTGISLIISRLKKPSAD